METTVNQEPSGAPRFQRCSIIAQAFLEKYKKQADPGSMRKSLVGVIMFLFGTLVTGLATLGPNSGPRTAMSYLLPGFFVVMTVVMLLDLKDHYLWRKKQDAFVLKWLLKNAKEKVEIRYVLGYVYQEGALGVQDSKEAAQWYEKAGGYSFADNDLGVSYATGDGVPQDVHKAFYLFKKAAKGGAMFAKANQEALGDI